MMPAIRIAIILMLVIAVQPDRALAAASCSAIPIPAEFSAGRAFATPIAASDNRRLRFWIDSDGSGFLFDDVAARYATSTPPGESTRRRATLPRWSARATIPALTSTLPIMARSDAAGDSILDGIDGQLGASWLQDRVWTFDYLRGTLTLRCDGTDPPHSKAEELKLS